jgi:hypothetical protein
LLWPIATLVCSAAATSAATASSVSIAHCSRSPCWASRNAYAFEYAVFPRHEISTDRCGI